MELRLERLTSLLASYVPCIYKKNYFINTTRYLASYRAAACDVICLQAVRYLVAKLWTVHMAMGGNSLHFC